MSVTHGMRLFMYKHGPNDTNCVDSSAFVQYVAVYNNHKTWCETV